MKNINEKTELFPWLADIEYNKIFNEKTEPLFNDDSFIQLLYEYIEKLNDLISTNELLSNQFNDDHVDNLTKSLKSNNLFVNGHKILLKNNKVISNLSEWQEEVNRELKAVYSNKEFVEINKKLMKNINTKDLKKILKNHKDIIIYLKDVDNLKLLIINAYLNNMGININKYYEKISIDSYKIKELLEIADKQKEKWEKVVGEFNKRFKVPFRLKIDNTADYVLKDKIPNLIFEYKRYLSYNIEQKTELTKEELFEYLSMGEKRALYLLHILFDIEMIKSNASNARSRRYLFIVDDIADSFDYKNKYAIIEYLLNLSSIKQVDMLILTHNFDFFRTVISRLGINRNNCFIIQKTNEEKLSMEKFPYLNDYFSSVIVDTINQADFSDDKKNIKLIASIPFYRNIANYILSDTEIENLTNLLHIKDDTEKLKISDVYNFLPNQLIDKKEIFFGSEEDVLYIDKLNALALKISSSDGEMINLENKILLSIAIRLKVEIYMKAILEEHQLNKNCSKNQTREWFNKVKEYLDDDIVKLIEDVNLYTPENIHINNFMYEPILDMSDWALKDLYLKVCKLK